jgi:DNA-binding MarR family transcriptional regulator
MNEAARVHRTLGTALRHLLELLDGDVEAVYREAGLNYRPRYTPIMRVLAESGAVAIRDLAAAAGVSHSAASQTVAKMKADGIVSLTASTDGRERAVKLTRRGKALLPKVELHWSATNAAADELDRELSARLSQCVEEAISALETKPFKQRIHKNATRLARRVSR